MDSISVQEAAEYFNVSERTIRRRIKSGQLNATQLRTSQGYEWRIHINNVGKIDIPSTYPKPTAAQLNNVAAQVDGGTDQLDGNVIYPRVQPTQGEQAVVKALGLVEKLQRENLELAGQVGYYQAKLQDAQEQIKLLSGPQEVNKTKIPWWKKFL